MPQIPHVIYSHSIHTSLALEITRARSSGTLDSKSTRAWATASSVSSAGAALAFWILCEAMIVLYTIHVRKKCQCIIESNVTPIDPSIYFIIHLDCISSTHVSIASIHIHISPIVIYIRFRTRKRESTLTDASLTSFSLLESLPTWFLAFSVARSANWAVRRLLNSILTDSTCILSTDLPWMAITRCTRQCWIATRIHHNGAHDCQCEH